MNSTPLTIPVGVYTHSSRGIDLVYVVESKDGGTSYVVLFQPSNATKLLHFGTLYTRFPMDGHGVEKCSFQLVLPNGGVYWGEVTQPQPVTSTDGV